MSYRDLRNFCEHLRVLNFPKSVSLESFRTPNFPLLADLLKWLVERFDPDAVLTGGPETMEDRILLIRSMAEFMATKANVKLNTKKLYGADGHAVREMLKVTSVLYEALHYSGDTADLIQDDSTVQFDVSSKINDIKRARELATEITGNGAALYDLLTKEAEYKDIREAAVARPLDASAAAACVERATEWTRGRTTEARAQLESVAAAEATLDARIEKRRAELARAEKRLQTMQKIKPAYQPEFNALESEIEQMFDEYVLKYRCIEALKQQLSIIDRAEAEAADEQQKAVMQLIQKYEAEDVLVNVNDTDDLLSNDEKKDSFNPKPEPRPATRPRTRLRVRTAKAVPAQRSRAFGSMSGLGAAASFELADEVNDLDDDDDSLRSSDDDADDLLALDERERARGSRRGAGGSFGSDDDEDLKALGIGVGDDVNSLGSSSGSSPLGAGPGGHPGSVAGSRDNPGSVMRVRENLRSVLAGRLAPTAPQDVISDDDF